MAEHVSDRELKQRLTTAAERVTVGGRYQHYRSSGLTYEVLTLALDETTLDPLVVYRAEYEPHISYARPVESFVGMVALRDGQEVPRFSLVETPAEPASGVLSGRGNPG